MNLVTLAEESADQNGFYVPQFELRIADVGLPRDVLRDVVQLTYKDSIKEIDSFEVTVNNWDPSARAFKYVGAETAADLAGSTDASKRYRLFDPCNKKVEVRMGYSGELRLMMLGTFTTLEPSFVASGAPTLAVRGLNAVHQLRRKQYSHEWHPDAAHPQGWRDSEIALDIANRTDKDLPKDQKRFPVPVVVSRGAQALEDPVPYVSQNNQYDIDFLLTRARRRGYVVYLREGDPLAKIPAERSRHLYFGPSDDKSPELRDVTFKLTWGATLVDFKPTLTTANQIKSVTVKGWDRTKKKGFAAKVSLDDKELAVDPELRKQLNECDPREEVVVNKPVQTEKEAKTLAKSILTNRLNEVVKAAVTCVGLPDLRAGMKVQIVGIGARFSGEYFILDSNHTISDGGYLTRFNARKVTGALEGIE
jgi:phage protein D